MSRLAFDRIEGPGASTRAAARQSAILDAAASVFMQLGFAGTTLDDICDALGATKGSIYYHFKNKSALFFAVQRRSLDLTRAALAPAAESTATPSQKLRAMAHAHALLIMTELPYLRVAAQGLELHLSGRTSAREREEMRAITALRDGNEALYIRVIEQGIEAGEFRRVDPRLLVKPLLGALNWTSRWYQPRPNETAGDRDAIASELAEFAVCAFRSLPAPRPVTLRALPPPIKETRRKR